MEALCVRFDYVLKDHVPLESEMSTFDQDFDLLDVKENQTNSHRISKRNDVFMKLCNDIYEFA